jgi:hypothetical protein
MKKYLNTSHAEKLKSTFYTDFYILNIKLSKLL